jgi:hypothetical protein
VSQAGVLSSVRRTEIRGEIVYAECGAYMPRSGKNCTNMVPLDKFGNVKIKCGVCGNHLDLKLWWMSKTQRDFQAWKKELRAKVERGEPITLQEFDRVAREHL